MITILSVVMAGLVINTIYSLGPMKLAINLLVMSLVVMLMLATSTGSSWFPLIFVLLFTGGILMVFIILSSFMPNEKSAKMKVMALATFLPISSTIAQLSFLGEDKAPDMIKCVLSSGMGATAIISMMLIYFVMFLEIIYTDKLPMRSQSCQKFTVL